MADEGVQVAGTIAGVTVVTVPMPRDGEHVLASRGRRRVLILPDDMPNPEKLTIIAQYASADAALMEPPAADDAASSPPPPQ